MAADSHWTLRNTTGTDLFCSAQIVVPRSGDIALLGGDILNGSRTTNIGNNKSNVFSPTTDALTPGATMCGALVRDRDHAAKRRDLYSRRQERW